RICCTEIMNWNPGSSRLRASASNVKLHSQPELGFMRVLSALIALAITASVAAAQDTSYAGVQRRGKQAMGVDQSTSTHKFDSFPDGGRIELQRDNDDSAGVATIRAHLKDIAKAFKAGDFSTPEFVHMRDVPGTKVMAAKRAAITYEMHNLPRGGE